MDFGRVIVGESASAPFSVENIDGNDFHLNGTATFAGPAGGDFGLVAAPPSLVHENQSVSGRLSFSPQDAGPRSAQIAVTTDSTAAPTVTGELTGIGVAPGTVTLVATPTGLVFGQVEILTSKQLPLRITNTGIDPAPLLPLRITGDAGEAFAVALADGGSNAGALAPLQPGASLDLAVSFSPPALGGLEATLEVQACRLCAPLQVPLAGVGFAPGLVFVPPMLSFSAIRGDSQTQPIQLVNQGNATTEVTNIVSNADAGADRFVVTFGSSSPVHLAHGDSFTFSVTYAPLASELPGTVDQAELTPLVNAANEQFTPGILTGTVGTDCRLSTPTSLFVGYAVPTYSTAQTLPVSNAGIDACTVGPLTIVPGSDPGFAVAPGVPASFSIAGRSDVGVAILFTPADATDPSLRKATLEIQTDQTGLPTLQVALSGYTQDTPYAKGSPWPRRCHDDGNSCLSGVDTSLTTATLQWRTTVCSGLYENEGANGPTIGGDGSLYVFSADGYLYAIDPAGRFLWASCVTSRGASFRAVEPTLAAGGVVQVVGGSDIDSSDNSGLQPQYFGFASDGGELWNLATPAGEILDDPLLRPDGVALLPLYAGDDSDLTGIAGFTTGAATSFLPCGGCYGAGAMSSDGTSYWATQTDAGPAILQLLPDGGRGFEIVADLGCGEGPGYFDGPILRGTSLYVSTSALFADGGAISELAVFDLDAGFALEWNYCDENDFVGSAAALTPDGGVILNLGYEIFSGGGLSSGGYGLAWIDPPGIQRWLYRMPSPPELGGSDPQRHDVAVGADGTVYFTSEFAALVALDPADGTVRWALDSGVAGTSSPAIGADGTIYFQDADGFLNAVR